MLGADRLRLADVINHQFNGFGPGRVEHLGQSRLFFNRSHGKLDEFIELLAG